MSFKLFMLLTITLCFIQGCNDSQKTEPATFAKSTASVNYLGSTLPVNLAAYNNTKGYWENGQIITEFDCPDSKFFPPINIKLWDKTPAVNGRFPTYEETKNGTAIHHYGEKENKNIKPYNMMLPKLASHYNRWTKTDEIVVVIQIAQTAGDTVVGYRYLTGGCGGSTFSNFHFLTDEEIKKIILINQL